MAKIRIVSDGTQQGTHVLNEDGTEICGVTKVSWTIEAGDNAPLAKAVLEFEDVELDVRGDA